MNAKTLGETSAKKWYIYSLKMPAYKLLLITKVKIMETWRTNISSVIFLLKMYNLNLIAGNKKTLTEGHITN